MKLINSYLAFLQKSMNLLFDLFDTSPKIQGDRVRELISNPITRQHLLNAIDNEQNSHNKNYIPKDSRGITVKRLGSTFVH